MSGGAVGKRLDNLQALRGVACLLVVVFHTAGWEGTFGLGFSPLRPSLWFGYAGVDLFFVLSGFIIATTCRADLGRAARLPRYLLRRAWRIYPTFWVALVPATALHVWGTSEWVFGPGHLGEWLDTVLLLPQLGGVRMLPVAWTLSYELMFYLAFGLLFLLPARFAVPVLGAWAVAVAAVLLAGHVPANRFALLAVGPFILEFLAGAAVAWCAGPLSGRRAAGLAVAAAVWCGIGSAVAFDPDPLRLAGRVGARMLVFGASSALLVFAAVGWERGGGRLGWRWLGRMGDASYSIYLVHGPVLLLVHYTAMRVGWGHGRLSHVAWLAAMLTAGVGGGLLLHRFVERPLLRLVERRPAEPRPAPVGEPEPVRRAA